MPSPRLPLLTVPAVLGLLLMAACGGGEKATPTPMPTARPPVPTVAPTATRALEPTPTPQPTTTRPAATATPRPMPTVTIQPQQPRGRLVVALANLGTEIVDPIIAGPEIGAIYGAAVFDWALWYSGDGSLAGGVFERWEQASDGMSWTFTIRDMKFHNGQSVTAQDVKFDLERTLLPESVGSNSSFWKTNLASVEVRSPKIAVAHLKKPWPLMNFFLSPTDGAQGAIFPKAAFEQAGGAEAFFSKPVGSGPFRLVEHRAGVRFLYEASGLKHPYRQHPEFQTLELLAVGEESTRVAMLRTGAATVAAISPESAPRVKRDGFLILELPGVTGSLLRLWGLDNPDIKNLPVGDIKVREALSLAVNRQELVDTLLGGFATVPAREIVVEGVEGFDPSWKPLPYDPTRAKELLAQAGYARGLSTKIYAVALPLAPWTTRASEAIAGYWKDVGVSVEIIPLEFGAYRAYYLETPHRRALGIYGWIPTIRSQQMLRGLAAHYSSRGGLHSFNSAELDDAIAQADATLDAGERIQLIRKVVDFVFKSFGSIPVAYSSALYAASKEIAGWDPVRIGGAGLSWETLRRR